MDSAGQLRVDGVSDSCLTTVELSSAVAVDVAGLRLLLHYGGGGMGGRLFIAVRGLQAVLLPRS